MSDPRSRIPGVDRLLDGDEAASLLARYSRFRVADAVRAAVAHARAALPEGGWPHDPADPGPYLRAAERRLAAEDSGTLRRVINATGVVLHTNLGRAPLAPEARRAMVEVAEAYSTLEFDLASGTRGSRHDHCRRLLVELTGADDALVINNCAAALVLAVQTVAAGAGVAVSRGELVEIGGGFRIAEMVARSGVRVVEVGSTNRTRAADYEAAFGGDDGIRAVLRVHRSNFRMVGFTESPTLEELGAVARSHGVPLLHDVGSGLLVDPASVGLPPEPTPRESLGRGADLVLFSGDKLLGGPQAGIIAGRGALVERLRRNPLARALRVDRMTLAALEATLRLYRDPETVRERVPVLAMLTVPVAELAARAGAWADHLGVLGGGATVEVVASVGRVGGGTCPGHELPTRVVRIADPAGGVGALAERLRRGRVPVIGRIVDGALHLDPRTVRPADEEALLAAVGRELVGGGGE